MAFANFGRIDARDTQRTREDTLDAISRTSRWFSSRAHSIRRAPENDPFSCEIHVDVENVHPELHAFVRSE